MRWKNPSNGARNRQLGNIFWRLRHLFAALCLGLATALALSLLIPKPASQIILVTSVDIPVGTKLSSSNTSTTKVETTQVTPHTLTSLDSIQGRAAAIFLPAGTALIPSMVISSDLSPTDPTNSVVSVTIDAGSAALIQAGAHIDLYQPNSACSGATTTAPTVGMNECPAMLLASNVLVLAVQSPEAKHSQVNALAQIETSPDTAKIILGATAHGLLQIARRQ